MNRNILTIGLVLLVAIVLMSCAPASAPPPVSAAALKYMPQTRNFTVTTVPLAVHELQDTLDFLKDDFAKGGVLEGKEVYAFVPSTLIVYQGDTVNLTIVNPEDDEHTFTLTDLGVNVDFKGKSTTQASFVASKVGTFVFICAVKEHLPYMWGQLVVLPDSAATP